MNDAAYFDALDAQGIRDAISARKAKSSSGGFLAMVAEKDRDSIPTLQATFNDMGYGLVGAMFPELITPEGFHDHGVILMPFYECAHHWVLPDLPLNPDELDKRLTELVSVIKQSDEADPSLFLIFDGMLPNIATVLDKLYLNVANQVHYFGVNAGSETFQPMPCLFDNDQYIGNGLMACLLPGHPGAMLSHDYHVPDMQMTATAAEGNRITSINWRPAFEVYQELVKEEYGVDITPENFYQYGVHFPFGISRLDGDPLVRIPVALQDDGSLFCVGEVPPNTLLTILNAVELGSQETSDKVGDYAQKLKPETLLNFYCAGRRMHLGDGAKDELHSLIEKSRPAAVYGALSLGEIGSSASGNYPLFHNAALVAAPW